MELFRRDYLAALEEDNLAKALFRVRPLLTAEGPVVLEDMEELADEGWLRIVPDKQEQYTFKDRMRTLGQLCMIRLSPLPEEVSKLRPNKNYAPQKGESNQYVLYSDVVTALDDLAIFEVLTEPMRRQPLTEHYYLRQGGHIQGPYQRGTGEPVDALSCIAPDSDRLYSCSLPDGRECLFYWHEMDVQMPAAGATQPQPQVPPVTEPVAPMPAADPQPLLAEAQGLGQLRHTAARLQEDLAAEGFEADAECAMRLMIHLLTAPCVCLGSEHKEDAALACQVIARTLGGNPVHAQGMPSGALHIALHQAPSLAALVPTSSDEVNPACGDACPHITLTVRRGFDLRRTAAGGAALQVDLLRQALDALLEEPAQESLDRLSALEAALEGQQIGLPLVLRHAVLGWLRCAPALLETGMEAALEEAACAWVLPYARQRGANMEALHGLCEGWPRAQALCL